MQETGVVRALAALAQDVRLRVFRALMVAGNAGLAPGAFAGKLEVASNTLSFHLKALVHGGLISPQRQGRNLIYRASFDSMNQLLRYLANSCCQGAECLSPDAVCFDCQTERRAL